MRLLVRRNPREKMTLLQLIRIIEKVALKEAPARCVVENDVFRLNALPNAKYGVFAWTQGQHVGSTPRSLRTFSFTFFYVARLRTDEKNQVEVQSVGCDVLGNILRTLEEEYGVEVDDYTITTFNQRFTDVCAGAFANVRLQVPASSMCVEENEGDFNSDFNEDFWTFIL